MMVLPVGHPLASLGPIHHLQKNTQKSTKVTKINTNSTIHHLQNTQKKQTLCESINPLGKVVWTNAD